MTGGFNPINSLNSDSDGGGNQQVAKMSKITKSKIPVQLVIQEHPCFCKVIASIRQRSRKWLWSLLTFIITYFAGVGFDALLKWLLHILSSFF
jgi:hypothetical protein